MGEKVITVLGEVSPEELGVTDGHSHIWISAQDVPAKNLPVIDDYDGIRAELTAYRCIGGGAQIDCQPGGAGRDAGKLRELSRESGVKIVACTGFHLKNYYPKQASIWKMSS